MGAAQALSERERQRIYQGRLQGKTLVEIARQLDCSEWTVRKWWRRYRREGQVGLAERRRGRPKGGALSTFPAGMGAEVLKLKRSHPGWGADRVIVELALQAQFTPLPSRSRVAAYFREGCPECLAHRPPKPPPLPAPEQAQAVHEIWQLDCQEKIVLADGQIATICSIRDPVGAAMIASQAFVVQTDKHWRKLSLDEVRGVLRQGFTEWRTMPDALRTDNELVLAGMATDPFPSRLTLWLVGLGIRHHFIRPHCPTDQPHIERSHRTLDGLALDRAALTTPEALQQALDQERQVYNTHFPSRASDCQRRPALEAHPELLRPRRPYQPDQEWYLFDLQRVYDFLATFPPFERKVSAQGQVSLGRRMYLVDRGLAGRTVWVSFDPDTAEWVIQSKLPARDEQPERLLALTRRKPKGLDAVTLTGLEPPLRSPVQPIQLSLPFLVAL